MEIQSSSPKPLPDDLYALCTPMQHTGNWREWHEECCRVMGEYGAIVFTGLDKTSKSAILVGIFAAFVKEQWHTHSYEALLERLREKPGELMSWLKYIADRAWASGPGQDAISATGYAARSLSAHLHTLSLKDRRAILKAVTNAALAYREGN
jgi:hypothetical protein